MEVVSVPSSLTPFTRALSFICFRLLSLSVYFALLSHSFGEWSGPFLTSLLKEIDLILASSLSRMGK